MKNFLSAIALALVIAIFIPAPALADVVKLEPLRLTDYNVNEFYLMYNNNAFNVIANGVYMANVPEKEPALAHNNFDVYKTVCQSNIDEGAVVVLIGVDKNGYIWYVSIVGGYSKVMNGTLTNIFGTIGLSYNDMKSVISAINKSNNALITCPSIGKNLIVSTRQVDKYIYELTFSAHTI